MRKLFFLVTAMLFFAFTGLSAQNDCATAVPITSIPFSSGTKTTCGTGNDFAAGFSCASTSYGGGEDYVYSISITNAPVSLQLTLGGAATYKVASVHSACPPTTANCIGGFTTGSSGSGTGLVTFPTNGTYYIVIDTWPAPACGEFTLDITAPPPPPANDLCDNAETLPVSSGEFCSGMVSGTTLGATASTGVPAPSCSATGVNDDVWYKFVATANTHLVTVHRTTAQNVAVQILSGSCGALTDWQCYTGSYAAANNLLSGLTVGNTYYVRVYSTSATAGVATEFNICVSTPVVGVPANDLCSGAIALSCGQTQKGIMAYATNETLPGSTCGSTTAAINKGMWFTYTPTVSGDITIDACGSDFDAYMRVYTGDCSTTLTCVGNTSGLGYADGGCTGILGDNPKVTFAATAGTTYYILLTNYSATSVGTYNITVTDPNCAPVDPCPAVEKHITQTTTTNLIDGLQCTAGGTISIFREFPLSGDAASTVKIKKINAGLYLSGAAGNRTFTVKVHTASGPLPGGTLTEVYSETVTTNLTANTYYTVNLTTPPSIPANSHLVIEFSATGQPYLMGMNSDGESADAFGSCNGGALFSMDSQNLAWNMVLDADLEGNAANFGSITPSEITIVEGQSTTLTASGGTAYLWSTGETTQSITVSPMATTTYTCQITFAPGCEGDYSSTVTVVPPTYCTPQTYGNIEGITNVTFADINNTSALPGTSYEDYTALAPANVSLNQTYPLSVQCFTGGNYTHRNFAYIDWNQDLDFLDANEVIEIGNITNSTGVDGIIATINVTVPADAVAGNTRMRIHSYYTSSNGLPNPNDGCTNYLSFGSWEDYTINVVATAPCPDIEQHITQTTTTNIIDGIQCTAGGTTSIFREFPLSGDPAKMVKVNKINAGLYIDSPGSRTFTVKVHTASAPLPGGTLTEVYSQTVTDSFTANTYYTVNLTTPPSIPANSILVIEISGTGQPYLYGLNNDGQTATAYASCDGGALIDLATADPSWNMVLDADIAGNAIDLGSITPSAITIVEGQSTTLTASPGTAYLWSTGETTQSITVSPMATTTYTCHITFGPGCEGDYSSTVTVVPPTYCTPETYANVEGITNVTFAGINNTTALPGDSYEDYTSLPPANVEKTATYPLSVQCTTEGSFTHRNFAYIDWNQDFDFLDANEIIDIGDITNSTGSDGITATVNITVPADALTGTTRMRIHSYYTSINGEPIPNDGCTNYLSWGSWEDYTINVSNLGVGDVNLDQSVQLYPNPTKDVLNVRGITPKQVKVYGIDGKLIPVSFDGNVINTHKLPTGVYIVQITDKDGNTVAKRFIKH